MKMIQRNVLMMRKALRKLEQHTRTSLGDGSKTEKGETRTKGQKKGNDAEYFNSPPTVFQRKLTFGTLNWNIERRCSEKWKGVSSETSQVELKRAYLPIMAQKSRGEPQLSLE